jgi:uroporphyrinogen III methyltransferase/synthase
MPMRPLVYIIGAGPGDPSLISVRGLQCLRGADVVLYDRLVSPRLLRHGPLHAERIEVGGPSPQALDQEAICYLIAEKAREGRIVARLKWGDPFVFDRGGEEALFLHEQGIPFEVVPGIPAALGVPTYAGVPVTYPGGGDTLTLVRGHEDERQTPPQVDWASLVRLKGTVVCYAGARQLAAIFEALRAHGYAPSYPVAVTFDGTLPTQRTLQGTLEEVAEAIEASPPSSPSILVLGRVTGLRDHLRWFDARPLFGRRILVTRPREDAAELSDLLTTLGADAIEAPMLRIAPPEDPAALDAAIARIGSFAWIVLTSPYAVDHLLGRLTAGPDDLRALSGVRLCTIGATTEERLRRHGLKPDLVTVDGHPEALVQAMARVGPLRQAAVLVPQADSGRDLVALELRRAGAEVSEVIAYRTVVAEPERDGEPDIYRLLLERHIDVVTSTSASAVRTFVRVIGEEQAADLLRQTTVACIGPVTAEAATQLGIETTIVPASEYTIPALVDAILQHYRKVEVAG